MNALLRGVVSTLCALAWLVWPVPASADVHSDYLTQDGIALYYAIIPAGMITGHPRGNPEAEMHGGVRQGKHAHHLMVAVFNAETSERISDVETVATVSEVGFPGETKVLEPMEIAGAMTYGAYFEVPAATVYKVAVTVKSPRWRSARIFKFEFRHQ